MVSVYTRRFALAYLPTGGPATVFVADDLHTYVIRDVRIHNRGTASVSYVGIVQDAGLFVLAQAAVEPQALLVWTGRQVILSSESIQVNNSGQPCTVLITGYALG